MGRDVEIGTLVRAWRRAREGEPGLVVVRGEAGVGKTRLVAELVAAARAEDAVVAESGCYGTSDRPALAPVADWLRVRRCGGWSGVIVGVDPDPANADAISRWARDHQEALHPYSAGGAYINFMMEEGLDRIRASYRGDDDRLVEIKHRYDPDNLFRTNQNIVPAGNVVPPG